MTDTPTDETPTETDIGTILVVEDEILIRLVIADYLRGCGYKVYEASSGDEAMILLQQGDLKIDRAQGRIFTTRKRLMSPPNSRSRLTAQGLMMPPR